MTLSELMDMTRLLAGEGAQRATDGALAQFLNVAQEDVSRDLRIPIQTVLYGNVNGVGAFSWPSDARDEAIIAVYALTRNEAGDVMNSWRIPVYDFQTASAYDPGWTMEKPGPVARFVVYDPTYEVASPYPVPPPSAEQVQAFRVTYVVRPTKMVEKADKPFNGRHESFHDVLAYRAAWLLTGNQLFMAEYERRMRASRGASNHGIVTVKNPLYTRTVIQSGRG